MSTQFVHFPTATFSIHISLISFQYFTTHLSTKSSLYAANSSFRMNIPLDYVYPLIYVVLNLPLEIIVIFD